MHLISTILVSCPSHLSYTASAYYTYFIRLIVILIMLLEMATKSMKLSFTGGEKSATKGASLEEKIEAKRKARLAAKRKVESSVPKTTVGFEQSHQHGTEEQGETNQTTKNLEKTNCCSE